MWAEPHTAPDADSLVALLRRAAASTDDRAVRQWLLTLASRGERAASCTAPAPGQKREGAAR
jgi:hypothetical protein